VDGVDGVDGVVLSRPEARPVSLGLAPAIASRLTELTLPRLKPGDSQATYAPTGCVSA